MTIALTRAAVFCGANKGNSHIYQQLAEELADTMVQQQVGLVYGGACVGIMGVLAERVLELGGEAIGVIPTLLANKELAHENLTELHIVGSMQERKALISSFADYFIMFPGGTGTLDEFFEVWVNAQLGLHQKPCAILNVNGYYDSLIQFLQQAVTTGFIHQKHYDMLIIEENPKKLFTHFQAYTAPTTYRWDESPTAALIHA